MTTAKWLVLAISFATWFSVAACVQAQQLSQRQWITDLQRQLRIKQSRLRHNSHPGFGKQRFGATASNQVPKVDATPYQPCDGGHVINIGNGPEGYGTVFHWDRKNGVADVVMWVGAADEHGVAIKNLKRGDRIQVLEITGLASFSGPSFGEKMLSLVTTLATGGANLLATEKAEKINKAVSTGEQVARSAFGFAGTGKRRDGYGRDKNIERCEGGIVVSLPGSGGVYTSRVGCIKKGPKPWHRGDSRRPDHVKHGFFPIKGNARHNTRTLQYDGWMFVSAWDRKFDDNKGYYRVRLRLIRGK